MLPAETNSKSGALAILLCNGLVTALILTRLALRRWRKSAFTIGDGWLVVALIFTGLRVVGEYHMNKYGTPLTTSIHDIIVPPMAPPMTEQEQNSVILAGKMTIATRVAVVVILWSIKLSILDLFNTFLQRLRRKTVVLWFITAVLALSFFASILSIFLECEKLELNWALLPNASKCSYGTVWIITYELSNIIADIMLFFLPMLLLLVAPFSKWKQAVVSDFGLGVVLAFGLGLPLIAVEIVRLAEGLQLTNMLLNRIVWGSIEVIIAAAIATLPTICVLLRFAYKERQNGGESTQRDAEAILASLHTNGDQAIDKQTNIGNNNLVRSAKNTRRPLLPRSMEDPVIDSIIDSVLCGARNRDSWSKPGPALRYSFRGSGAVSRISSISSGTREGEDGLRDALVGWIELEGVDTESVDGGAPSLELDELDRGEEIFLAKEVHRGWELDQRPRIITIPRRAKLSGMD
ncbi:hypothetical protein F5Y03DRAFT_5171 [Xylaria venustula]|nr:hypothetical protein F5Y03DRAFT_5171 [Xylaria venustula]